ncbi:MAG: HDIG domain-containing protein [Candidatus Fermentithermobacillus carboniphilus]|uniref:HDIG domain-containing protein n=1 Tax=Candidatus Fermentithermobacillus carboniphilus TaxID=3085328 RepID=A0AAT9LI22_9FIRM|nr:MAG: HDIG domain-containing protein [Candidatus Fermentithermobacillus carboniphilus]
MSQREAERDSKNRGGNPTRPSGDRGRVFRTALEFLRKIKLSTPSILWASLGLLVTFGVFFVSLVPPQIGLKAGEVAPFDVKATREVIDDAATERLKEQVIRSVSQKYDSDERVLEEIKSLFKELGDKISVLSSSTNLTTQDIVKELRPFLSKNISDADIIGVVATSPDTVATSIAKAKQIVEDILQRGLKPEHLETGKEEAYARIAADKAIPDQVARFLSSFVEKNLKPNLILNQAETDKQIKEALAAVEPVRIRRGEYIVRKGEVVSQDQIAILEKLGMVGPRVRFSAVSGAGLMALLFCGFIAVYLYLFYPDATDPKNSALLSSIVILSLLAIKGFSAVSGLLAPVAAGVMLASTLVDRRFGTFFAACLTLAVGVMTGFELKYMALSLVAGLASALSVKKVWNRTQLFRAGLVVMLVSSLTFISLGLTGAMALGDVFSWQEAMFVLLNGPLSAVLAVGSLPLFETMFGIITPIKLIELSNPEHPLLHRLLLEAPGTYHHSIMVGNLAEAAAWAIGADSLLTRVGAYYHDVGKIKRPYLFAENQIFGMENPHDKMNPSLSSAVVISHVKDGLELAREHKVPEVIQKFIAEHHGTTLASYFYAKASETASKDGRPPEEWDFRYEGPRPSTKETAIVMLADSVEAATRALSKPTPARIESVVRRIIHERLMDHQLDRSDLTLKELDIIAETFTRVLAGVFHTRIEYPAKPGKEGVPDKDSPSRNGGQ